MPFYRRTLADDRARMAEIQADIAGTPHPAADPAWSVSRALLALSAKDPRILRAYVRNFGHILDQGAAFDEPGVRAVFDQLAPTLPRYPDTTPTRAQVLAAIRAVEHSPAYVPA